MQVCLGGVHYKLGVGLVSYNRFQKCNSPSRACASLLSFAGSVQPPSSEGDLDLIEEFLGPSKHFSREALVQRPHVRSWYGKDGELVSMLPCPECRGRGYNVCPSCDSGTPMSSCVECFGKGLKRCSRCLGKRAILMQSVDEEILLESVPCGPLHQIEDDDIIDRMDIQFSPHRRSKRLFTPTPAEVREKIRHSLKSLDARTGSITRRMRRIHNDPVLNAKRIAAIKKAKSTEAARKQASEQMRLYFQDPENRRQRSLSIKGKEYFCGHCGGKGHRRHYCPVLPKSSKSRRLYRCSLCGQSGHKRTKCRRSVDE